MIRMKIACVSHVEDPAVPRHLIHITAMNMQPFPQAVSNIQGIYRLRELAL